MLKGGGWDVCGHCRRLLHTVLVHETFRHARNVWSCKCHCRAAYDGTGLLKALGSDRSGKKSMQNFGTSREFLLKSQDVMRSAEDQVHLAPSCPKLLDVTGMDSQQLYLVHSYSYCTSTVHDCTPCPLTALYARIVWSELHVLHSRVFYDPVCTGTSQKGTDGAREYEYPYEYPVKRLRDSERACTSLETTHPSPSMDPPEEMPRIFRAENANPLSEASSQVRCSAA